MRAINGNGACQFTKAGSGAMSLHKNLSSTPSKAFTAPSDVPSVALEGFSTVASFSWMTTAVGATPTLAIPGEPPKWIQPALPLRLPADQGLHYVDLTGDQCEQANVCRLMPLFQSIEHCAPDFDFMSINLVCNRNNLRNLLRWTTNTTKKDFRIDLQLVNDKKTLVMLEYEAKCTEYISPGTFRGFGDNFRKKTVRAPSTQTRHNRIVTYKLGQFRVLMGHKVEAHVENATYGDPLESLMSSFNALDVTDSSATKQLQSTQKPGYLPVRITSSKVKEYDFVEIKTMAQRKSVDWEDFYPQIYLSKTSSLHAAFHARGQFVTIEKYGLDDNNLVEYKISVENSLGKLLEFLRRLTSTLKTSGDGPWALVCVEGNMKLYKSAEAPLPDAILSKF